MLEGRSGAQIRDSAAYLPAGSWYIQTTMSWPPGIELVAVAASKCWDSGVGFTTTSVSMSPHDSNELQYTPFWHCVNSPRISRMILADNANR